jgi:hypothetical protein
MAGPAEARALALGGTRTCQPNQHHWKRLVTAVARDCSLQTALPLPPVPCRAGPATLAPPVPGTSPAAPPRYRPPGDRARPPRPRLQRFNPSGRGSEMLARTTARPACVGASGSSPVGCSVDPAVAGSRAVSGEPAGVRVQRPDMPAPTTPSGCSAPEVVLCRPAGRAYAALMRARSARLNMGQPTHDPWILLRGQAAPMAGLNYSHRRQYLRW